MRTQRKKGSKAKAKPLPIDDRRFKEVVLRALSHLLWVCPVRSEKSQELKDEIMIDVALLLHPVEEGFKEVKETLEEKK